MRLFVLGLFFTALALCSCSRSRGEGDPAPEHHPVLLVGLDGIEWDVVLPMLEAGRLPHLAALMEAGSWGELETLVPTVSPAVWTTIATGVAPEVHGIQRFRKDGGQRLVNSGDRKAAALWDVANAHGRSAAVVGWWATWPVEPIDGVMVAQVNVRRTGDEGMGLLKGALFPGLGDQVYPPTREEEILALAEAASRDLDSRIPEMIGGAWEPGLGEVPDALWRESRWSVRGDAIYRDVTLRLLETAPEPYDLVAVYLGGPDVLGHRFWRYYQPEAYEHPPTAAEVEALGDLLPAYYAWTDHLVGELVAAMPDDAITVVVSDHGMEAVHVDRTYRPTRRTPRLISGGHPKGTPAFFVAAGPHVRASGRRPATRAEVPRVGSVHDVMPTLCALMDLPVAADGSGDLMGAVIDPAFRRAYPPRRVATHTPEGWAEGRQAGEASDLDAARQEQLEALGYFE